MPILNMDSIEAEKLQAMKNFKKHQFLNNLILHSLTALAFSLLCSYPSWFPHLCSFVKHFVSLFFTPKCLFVVGNAIIVFLVGESKLASSRSSPAIHMEKKEEERKLEMNLSEESVNKIEEREEEQVRNDEYGDDGLIGGDNHDNKEEEERDEEEELGLPTEEFNKRVEDFIAKVNKQRLLEARLLDCGRG
ncbi:unnamed protein product [Camellia sinensis]